MGVDWVGIDEKLKENIVCQSEMKTYLMKQTFAKYIIQRNNPNDLDISIYFYSSGTFFQWSIIFLDFLFIPFLLSELDIVDLRNLNTERHRLITATLQLSAAISARITKSYFQLIT